MKFGDKYYYFSLGFYAAVLFADVFFGSWVDAAFIVFCFSLTFLMRFTGHLTWNEVRVCVREWFRI